MAKVSEKKSVLENFRANVLKLTVNTILEKGACVPLREVHVADTVMIVILILRSEIYS